MRSLMDGLARTPHMRCGGTLLAAALTLVVMIAAPVARADDPGGLADNDFGNNGNTDVPEAAYAPGKKERESKEYKKENPDAGKRDYYEKGGKESNHDNATRAKIAYKAARYTGPTNGYNAGRTAVSGNHKDGPRPKAGGGKYDDNISADPAVIVGNIYKFVEDIIYPKEDPGQEEDDAHYCGKINDGTIDIGKPFADDDTVMCKTAQHFFTSLVRELGFPVREVNLIPSTGEGKYDTQTAACEVWYDGAWHFFDAWESFKASDEYLQKKGHAGYGPYHDADIWIRTSAPKRTIPSDYAAETGRGGNGKPGNESGWKKTKTHKKNGTKIETQTFALRLDVQDALGRTTGGASGALLTDIPDANYFPWDKPAPEEMLRPTDPAPGPYGAEIVTLLHADNAPPGSTSYTARLFNPTGAPMPFSVGLTAMPSTVNMSVSPPSMSGTLMPGELRSIPFAVIFGAPIPHAPSPVIDMHARNQVNQIVTLSWTAPAGATSFRLYASSQNFETPTDPGVTFVATTTSTSSNVTVTNETLYGVEAVGAGDMRSGLDPGNGSTTLALVFTTGIPALTPWGAAGFVLMTLATGAIVFGLRWR